MAAKQPPRKSGADRTPSSSGSSASAARKGSAPAGRGSTSAGGGTARTGSGPRGATAVKRKPGKSIVSKKQIPWGLIVASTVVVAFAIGVVAFAVTRHKSSSSASPTSSSSSATPDPKDPWRQPEVAAAESINGLIYRVEPNHTHVTHSVQYDTSPPIGGDHSYVWVDCSGTVYPKPIANENAVHGLEHGAVWITYRPGLASDQVSTLSALVAGQNYMFMSPYDGLKSPISLQAWGYQLFVNSASDPRIKKFIAAVRSTPKVTPEYPGQCSDPTFKQKPSTPGHPIFP